MFTSSTSLMLDVAFYFPRRSKQPHAPTMVNRLFTRKGDERQPNESLVSNTGRNGHPTSGFYNHVSNSHKRSLEIITDL